MMVKVLIYAYATGTFSTRADCGARRMCGRPAIPTVSPGRYFDGKVGFSQTIGDITVHSGPLFGDR